MGGSKRRVIWNGRREWSFCIECAEPHSVSRAPTKSFQYTKSHKWAHDSCTGFSNFYVCRNCNSVIIMRIWCLNSYMMLETQPFWDLSCFDKWQSDFKLVFVFLIHNTVITLNWSQIDIFILTWQITLDMLIMCIVATKSCNNYLHSK